MKGYLTRYIMVWFVISLSMVEAQPEIGRRASGKGGVVAAGKREAVAAGMVMFDQGGNAVDAAVSSLLVLSVRHIGAFCIGGEVPMIIYDAKKQEVKVLSGQGAAPLDSSAIAWYYRHGIPGSDIRAAAVPGVIDLCVTALQLYGTFTFAQVAEPVLAILDAGGPNWYRDTGSGRMIDGISGKVIDEGLFEVAGQGRSWYSDLAMTIRRLIEAEQKAVGTREERLQAVSDRFYRGDIADEFGGNPSRPGSTEFYARTSRIL